MRDAIYLLGKVIEIEETRYQITNINFVPNTSIFYIELENNGEFLNMSLKDISPYINEQINEKNNYRKKYSNSHTNQR
jgi:hypothetical protein